jgi:hypothetical protein
MTTLTETVHAGEFLQSEANGFLSREAAPSLPARCSRPARSCSFPPAS